MSEDDKDRFSGSSFWSGPAGVIVVGALVAILAVGSLFYARQMVFGHDTGSLALPAFEETPEATAGIETRDSGLLDAGMRTKQSP
ncbi:hypothetical protein [Pseudoroseicyclus sp. CXY001]|uniref:hypothetical protein n=1 Tax=Pseudoroseicyclus sp. CXY001 TaxID=3242492 RepID=UPI00358DD38E